MDRQSLLVLGISLSLLAATAAPVVAADSGAWPTRWTVNGNGVIGALEITIGDDGSLSGRLLDQEIEGYISGRHLLVRRTLEDRVEVWDGWLGQPPSGGTGEETAGSNLILAGTITVDAADGTKVYPWFGRPDAAAAATSATPASVAPDAAAAPVPAPTPAAAPTPSPAPPPAERAAGPLTGFWSSLQGSIEIVQDGNQLTAILPDGSSRSGRMTGDDTLVVGLRKGCCNGHLEESDVIVWSDGSRWKRSD